MAVGALYDFEQTDTDAFGDVEPYGLDAAHTITYRLYDTLNGQWILTLPFSGVNFGGGPINSAGSFSGKLAISDPNIQSKDWISATEPTKSTLIVDLDGVILWGGIITGRKESFTDAGVSMEIDAQEGLYWLTKVLQATDYSSPPYSGITGIYTPMSIWNALNGTIDVNDKVLGTVIAEPYIWDPMCMMYQILHDAFYDVPYQDLYNHFGVMINGASGSTYIATSGAGGGGPTNYVSITFPYTSLQTLASILQQFNTLGYGVGFDACVKYSYDGDGDERASIHADICMSYPIQGSTKDITIDVATAHEWEWPEDGTAQATTVYETGGNQDIVVVQNINAVGPGGGGTGATVSGYPNSSRVFNIANLNSPNPTQLLRHMGQSDLLIYSWPPTTPVITVDFFDSVAGMGQWEVGDIVTIYIPQMAPYYSGFPGATGASGVYDFDEKVDFLFDPRFPTADFYSSWRIISYEATVADQGGSTVAITFDLPPNSSGDAPNRGILGASGA